MKLNIQYRHHEPSASFSAAVQQHLEGIAKLRRIDEAEVLVEHSEEGSPAFSVDMHLVTPGPDLNARSKDHTLRAALRKVVGSIEAQLAQRESTRGRRLREQPLRSSPALAGRSF
jgi:ribosome-associated translation inhibitor RaiA